MKKVLTIILVALSVAGFLIIQELRASGPYKMSDQPKIVNSLVVGQKTDSEFGLKALNSALRMETPRSYE